MPIQSMTLAAIYFVVVKDDMAYQYRRSGENTWHILRERGMVWEAVDDPTDLEQTFIALNRGFDRPASYDIVTGSDPYMLREKVRQFIAKGWEPQGGLSVIRYVSSNNGEIIWNYSQAIFKIPEIIASIQD